MIDDVLDFIKVIVEDMPLIVVFLMLVLVSAWLFATCMVLYLIVTSISWYANVGTIMILGILYMIAVELHRWANGG